MSSTAIPHRAAPDHVPAELFWDHDYEQFTAEGDDPFLAASRLHEGPDILWARALFYGEPGWILTRHDHIAEVFSTPEHFSSKGEMFDVLGLGALIPLECDPPVHQRYRNVVSPAFTPNKVAALEPRVREVCHELLAPLEGRDACEFIGEFAEKFPSYIFLDLMGMPREMLPEFLAWERGMLRDPDPARRVEAMRKVIDYLQGFLAERRAASRSGLVEHLFTTPYAGERPLDDREILNMAFVLFIGGLDTVYSTLGWIFRHLAGDPELQARLRAEPEILPRAVEEFLRAFSVASSQRTVVHDLDFHGVSMRAGDAVQLSLVLAGRDPRAYQDPHRVDVDRNPRHLAFGTGSHACIGLHLARLEIRVVLEAFLARFQEIRIPRGESYRFHTGNVFGVDRLPLEWRCAAG